MEQQVKNLRPFSAAELERRVKETHRRMQKVGLDALWVTSPPNINYLSGYDAWSFYVHQGLLLAPEWSLEPAWLGRAIDINCARHTTYLDESHIFGYEDQFLQPPLHAMDFIGETLKSLGLHQARIGIEMDTHYLSPLALEKLRIALPYGVFINADGLINWQRCIKSPQELAYMQQAAQLTDSAMRAGINMINTGVRQCDVAGVIYQNLIAGQTEFHGDVPDFQTMPTGARSNAPHLTWTHEQFSIGQVCTLELGANRYRYHAPLARTVVVGKEVPKLTTFAAQVTEGLEAALAAVRPGQSCESVELAWRRVISSYGMEKRSRIGYSVGIGYPPDWGERTASLMPGDTTELQPGMVFHLMLGMWEQEVGYEISETFYVSEKEAVCFSNLPRRLFSTDEPDLRGY